MIDDQQNVDPYSGTIIDHFVCLIVAVTDHFICSTELSVDHKLKTAVVEVCNNEMQPLFFTHLKKRELY